MPRGRPAAPAARIWSRAIRGLVWKATSCGIPAVARRSGSPAQASGRYRRQATGRLARSLASDSVTATWQLSCLPSWPQYWRATPTEWRPFLGMPVSSTIQAVAFDLWHNISADCLQQSGIAPHGLGNEVMQRLMLGLNAFGIKARRHRLDALAVAVEQQAEAIGPERRLAVGMTQSTGKFIQIRVQTLLSAALTMFNTVLSHAPYIGTAL